VNGCSTKAAPDRSSDSNEVDEDRFPLASAEAAVDTIP
jgi:hypothetical protein